MKVLKKIHEKYSNGYERWTEYDEFENEISMNDTTGYWRKTKYDERGYTIHRCDSLGFDESSSYDKQGKTQLGTKIFIQNYENSKHTYSKYEDESSFKEEWYDFNKNGKIVHIKEHEELFECDKQGNRLHVKSIFEIEKWWKYNEHGKIIHYKDSSGKEYINVYDGNEHKIILEDKQGNRQIEEYDDDWDLIYSKAWNGDECWKEYYDKQRQNN